MHKKIIYEYAVIRCVPRVEREEFLNIGIIIYCKELSVLDLEFYIVEAKLKAFHDRLDINEIKSYLFSWKEICKGNSGQACFEKMDKGMVFRWITAVKSTILQTSKQHSGITADFSKTMHSLMQQYCY